MRISYKLVAGFVLALLLGVPVMACMAPDAQLSPADKSCCKAMARQCGALAATSSHSCCRQALPEFQPFLTAGASDLAGTPAHNTVLAIPVTEHGFFIGFSYLHDSESVHSPPPPPPTSITNLRI